MQAATVPAPADGRSPAAEPVGAAPFVSPPAKPDDAARRAKLDRHYYRNQALIASSYTLDGLFMLLFWLAGTVSWKPAVFYTLIGLSVCAFWVLLRRTGWMHRRKDPDLVMPMNASNSAVQIGAMVLVPELGFMAALILFIIYISLTLRVPVRQALVAWGLVSLGVGSVLAFTHTRLHIPAANLAEQLLAWSFFALTLWRCIFLGTYNSAITALLKKRSGELAELTRKVEQLAHRDELTGLLNRRSLLTILTEERRRADRMGGALSVAMLDLDKFKSINDTLGHLAGDKTLKIFSATAQQVARRTDRFGRYGGEEFLMVLIGTRAEDALVPIERIREALHRADWHDVAPDFSVTFSCGIATYRPGESTEDLIRRADDALYRAKGEGRNCSRIG